MSNSTNKLPVNGAKISVQSPFDCLYQAISLIETKNYQVQQMQQSMPQAPIGEYASSLINENKKRMIGNFIYQNQQLPTPQTILSNNENFSLVNLQNLNKLNPCFNAQHNKIMPSCSCCNLNQYIPPYYHTPAPQKSAKLAKKDDKRINTLINNRQMQLKDFDAQKVNNPASRLEKAKQFARNAEFQSSTSSSPVYSSNSNSPVAQFQNQYFPVDVLYTLLPMYLNPFLNKPNIQANQQVDPNYVQSLVSFFLNSQQQQQQQQLHHHHQPQFKQSNSCNPNTSNSHPFNHQSGLVSPASASSSNKSTTRKTGKTKICHLDVNSKVDEHFKRSLGNEYFNMMPESKKIKLDTQTKSKEDEHSKQLTDCSQPHSPCSSIKSISSCTSPILNINETSNQSIESVKSDEIKNPEYVDTHFSKALGLDTWNKIKRKIKTENENSSDIPSNLSSMSETSLASSVKL